MFQRNWQHCAASTESTDGSEVPRTRTPIFFSRNFKMASTTGSAGESAFNQQISGVSLILQPSSLWKTSCLT